MPTPTNHNPMDQTPSLNRAPIEQGFPLAVRMGTRLIGESRALYASDYQNSLWSCKSGTICALNICMSPQISACRPKYLRVEYDHRDRQLGSHTQLPNKHVHRRIRCQICGARILESVCESFLQFILLLNAAGDGTRKESLATAKLMHVKDPNGVRQGTPIAAY